MNHFIKNPDAHRRLARGANAFPRFRGFSRLYQRGTEFKARQLWLDFKDAVGPALEAICDAVDKSRQQFKHWLKAFRMPEIKTEEKTNQLQLALAVDWTAIKHKRAA